MFEGKILLVDDQPVAAQDSIAALEHFAKPSQILFAGDAKAARQILDTEPVRLAFLDIEMPGGDGFSLAAYMEERHPGLPYVFLTGHADFALESYEYEPVDFLTKPVDIRRMERTFEKVRKKAGAPRKEKIAVRSGADYLFLEPIRSSTSVRRSGKCRSTGRTGKSARPPTPWRSWSGSSWTTTSSAAISPSWCLLPIYRQ